MPARLHVEQMVELVRAALATATAERVAGTHVRSRSEWTLGSGADRSRGKFGKTEVRREHSDY